MCVKYMWESDPQNNIPTFTFDQYNPRMIFGSITTTLLSFHSFCIYIYSQTVFYNGTTDNEVLLSIVRERKRERERHSVYVCVSSNE